MIRQNSPISMDGSIIFGRTLEFATDLKSNVIVVPRGDHVELTQLRLAYD
jgi:penicillin V acylase-like amidase (Ntn superfamily)